MSDTFTSILQGTREEQEDGRSRRVREILEEGWDLFLRVFADGSFVVQAVAVSSGIKCSGSDLRNAHYMGDRTLTDVRQRC